MKVHSVRSAARAVVDSWMPGAGHAFRQFREKRRAVSSPLETPYGFKLAGHPSMADGTFERDEIAVFLKYVRNVSTCIDIGANNGLYTCLAVSEGKKVVAIEPLRDNLSLLYANLLCNGYTEVEVFPLGLASKPGLQRIFGESVGASFIPGWAGASARYYEVVPVTTLDTITNSRFDSGDLLIKMDVEGFENEVLKGAKNTLRASPKPIWLIEICLSQHFPGGRNENFSDTFDVFWSNGYEARVPDDTERVIQPQDVERWANNGRVDFGSHNYLFVPGSERL